MMDAVFWWFGAIHIVVYAVVGVLAIVVALTIKAHMMAKVMGRIIQWHYARGRFQRGEIKQEPRP